MCAYLLAGRQTETYVRREAENIIACSQRHPRRIVGLIIERRGDGQLLGLCALFCDPTHVQQAYLGFELNRLYWGKGYATEAADALLNYGFREMNLRLVFGNCFAANAASIRVLQKLGMRRNPNRLSEWLMTRKYQELRPIVSYRISAKKWTRHKAVHSQSNGS